MTEQAELQSIHCLWRDYAFLTHELAKFAVRQEWDMVFNLLDQRAVLQKRIDEQGNRDFAASAEGKILLNKIVTEERMITQTLRVSRNQAQNQQRVASAYDAFSSIPAGSLMNRGT
jgi:hypothetical protein